MGLTPDQRCQRCLDTGYGINCIRLKSLDFSNDCFVRPRPTKQFSCPTKPFFALGADIRKHRMVIDRITKTADSAGSKNTGDSQMRTLSLFLAFAFVLAGSSIAGSLDGGLPGIGTFAYNGSPIAASASQALVVAAR
jgi:hypothetical protein